MFPQSFRLRQADRGLRWLSDFASHSESAGLTRIRERTGLLPIGDSDGAILVWLFDEKPGATEVLFVRLTEDEADAVYSADPYTVGVLEPVRRKLRNRWAVLAVRCGQDLHTRPYRIPTRVTEEAFIAELDKTAASCPAFSLLDRRTMVPDAQVFAQDMARELAFA
jgi:hypothetical protein